MCHSWDVYGPIVFVSAAAFHGPFSKWSSKRSVCQSYSGKFDHFLFFFSVSQTSPIPPLLRIRLLSRLSLFLSLLFRNYYLHLTGNHNNPVAAWRESFSFRIRMHVMRLHIKSRLCLCVRPPPASQECWDIQLPGLLMRLNVNFKFNGKISVQDCEWSSISWCWNKSVWADVVVLWESITWQSVSKQCPLVASCDSPPLTNYPLKPSDMFPFKSYLALNTFHLRIKPPLLFLFKIQAASLRYLCLWRLPTSNQSSASCHHLKLMA